MRDLEYYNAVKKLKHTVESSLKKETVKGLTVKLLKMNSTKRREFLNRICFVRSDTELTSSEELQLIQNKMIASVSPDQESVTLTVKGAIILEYGIENLDLGTNKFLDDVNSLYFLSTFGKGKTPLESQEKAVIIAMMGILAISPNTAVKLSSYNDPYSNVQYFKECVDKSISFLKQMGEKYVDSKIDKIWDLDVRGEDPVNARFARLNSIQGKTDNIYQKSGSGHYLKLLDGKSFNKAKTETLLKKIFDKGPLDYEQREKFISLLKEINTLRYKVITNEPDYDALQVKYLINNLVLTLV